MSEMARSAATEDFISRFIVIMLWFLLCCWYICTLRISRPSQPIAEELRFELPSRKMPFPGLKCSTRVARSSYIPIESKDRSMQR